MRDHVGAFCTSARSAEHVGLAQLHAHTAPPSRQRPRWQIPAAGQQGNKARLQPPQTAALHASGFGRAYGGGCACGAARLAARSPRPCRPPSPSGFAPTGSSDPDRLVTCAVRTLRHSLSKPGPLRLSCASSIQPLSRQLASASRRLAAPGHWDHFPCNTTASSHFLSQTWERRRRAARWASPRH
jgi:hypothetical protein